LSLRLKSITFKIEDAILLSEAYGKVFYNIGFGAGRTGKVYAYLKATLAIR